MTSIPEIFEQAFQAVLKGESVRVIFASPREAVRWRQQANRFRRLDREANERLPAESRLWGKSVYDDIELGLDGNVVILRPRLITPISVEIPKEPTE